ncbi:MAG: Asp-tRNA(Asn)/Glu-tRNA(Gln) amidotransferase subunit GatA [bacterium]|nr:Asp-tRNA(Asn)/Glu-tRNA(Gln) amidotransferase subunit GatA [bacterium]
MSKLNQLTIVEAARALRAREISVRELWDACHEVAREKNPELNAFLEIFDADDSAISAAQERIEREGDAAPLLCGIPLAIKDNILIEGHIASAASKMLENYRAPYNATVIEKLKAQNALFVGRTNMDEFALGGSTENSAFGVTKNPHDTSRVAGGTSGGSAAAVAAHMCIAALGSDTGGSVRNPASFCGVVGMKPTYGTVSRYGLIAAVSSFDQIGPLAKTVEDAQALFNVISGKDAFDSNSIERASATAEVKKIGIPRKLLTGVAEGVRKDFGATLEKLAHAGYEIIDIETPLADAAIAAYYIINFAEVSTNLARFDGIRYGLAKRGEKLLDDYVRSRTEGFGPETRRRILLGTFVLSSGYIDAYYRKANAVRAELQREYEHAFELVDIIATPTMPTTAFKIGEKSAPVSMYLEDIFTVTANLTGMPAISVPMVQQSSPQVGEVASLPVGIHFTAPHQAEERLFTISCAL